jgi:hypothetical protein
VLEGWQCFDKIKHFGFWLEMVRGMKLFILEKMDGRKVAR